MGIISKQEEGSLTKQISPARFWSIVFGFIGLVIVFLFLDSQSPPGQRILKPILSLPFSIDNFQAPPPPPPNSSTFYPEAPPRKDWISPAPGRPGGNDNPEPSSNFSQTPNYTPPAGEPSSDPNVTNPPLPPSIISRVITYPLEGNWEIKASARLKKSDGSIFQRVYNFRLIVQKEPPNSGAVTFKDFPFRIVGLTKEGNKFTIQTEAIIFGGVISLQGRIISNNSMEGSCKLSGAITEGYDWIISNFTGQRVEHFDLRK